MFDTPLHPSPTNISQSFVNYSRIEIYNSSLCRGFRRFFCCCFCGFLAGVGRTSITCPEVNDLSMEKVHLFHQNILEVSVIRTLDFSCRHLVSEMMQESKYSNSSTIRRTRL